MNLYHLQIISNKGDAQLPRQCRFKVYDTKAKALNDLQVIETRLKARRPRANAKRRDDVLDVYKDGRLHATIWVMDMPIRPVQDDIPEAIRYNATKVAEHLTYWAYVTGNLYERLVSHPDYLPKEAYFVGHLMDNGHTHWHRKMQFKWPST